MGTKQPINGILHSGQLFVERMYMGIKKAFRKSQGIFLSVGVHQSKLGGLLFMTLCKPISVQDRLIAVAAGGETPTA